MSWKSMNRKCDGCGHIDEYLADSKESRENWFCQQEYTPTDWFDYFVEDTPQIPWNTTGDPIRQIEEYAVIPCIGIMRELFARPAIRTSDSASFLDGTKRPEFEALRREQAEKSANDKRG